MSRLLASASTSIDESDPVTARRLALAAWSESPTAQAKAAVVTELTQQVRDGDLPAEAVDSGSASLIGGGVTGLAFSPDGKLLATAGADVRLWDPGNGRPVGVPLAVDGFEGSTGVAFSPDGRLVASADAAGDVQVWDAASGHLDLNLRSNAPLVTTVNPFGQAIGEDVAFSPDGRLVASGSSDGYARIWKVATGTPAGHPIAVDPPANAGIDINDPGVTAVAFSPDRGLLATAGESGDVQFWNPVTGAPAATPLPVSSETARGAGGVAALAFSADGKQLATAARGGPARIWTIATRSAIGPLTTVGLAARSAAASCSTLAFSTDGRLVACGGLGATQLFDARTGKYLSELIEPDISAGDDSVVNVVAFSSRGDLLATGNTNGTATLWDAGADADNGTTIGAQLDSAVSQSHDAGVLLASPDTLMAGPGSDGYAQLVGSALPAGANQGALGISSETFSPDGRLAAVVSGRQLRLLDAQTGKQWRKPIVTPNQLAGAVFSPNGNLVATVGIAGSGQLWNTATETSIGPPFTTGDGVGYPQQLMVGDAIAFSPDGQLLAVSSQDGGVTLLSTVTGDPIPEPTTTSPSPASSAATATPPSPRVVVGSPTGAVAFSANGRLLASAGIDGYVRLRNPTTGAPEGSIAVDPVSPGENSQGVAALALSPDGRYLATVDGTGQIQLWDTATRAEVGLPIPAGTLSSSGAGGSFTPAAVAFSADGSVLVGVDGDGDVQAWPTWLLADPHAALCAQVGPPTAFEWAEYAPGEPEPNMCGSQR